MHKPLANPEFFGLLGKPLVLPLLEQFRPAFAARQTTLPDPGLDENQYFQELSHLAVTKKGFPEKLMDVFYGIAALNDERGKNRLLYSVRDNPLITFSQTSTYEGFALEFYLAAPALFEKVVQQTQILARSSFQVFGSTDPLPEPKPFKPTEDELRRFKADIDQWVADEYRGQERATHIETYEMEDEHLFLIRIGDSFTRQAVFEDDGLTYRHFRPARDLVVTHAPARNEIRINGKGTKKIRMLRETFGRRFFGDPDRFSVKDPFTLAPLVKLGKAALEFTPGQGIDEITLTEFIQQSDGRTPVTMRLDGPDLFAFSESERTNLFWNKFKLIGAGFSIRFTGQLVPRQFFLREGNGLRQVRNSDVTALYRWMTDIGFRKVQPTGATANDRVAQN